MEDWQVSERFNLLSPLFDERLRRIYSAVEAKVIGRGGISQVSRATGISRRAIYAGLKEIEERTDSQCRTPTIRKKGGGRKKVTAADPSLISDLESLLEPYNNDSSLSWTTKGLRRLAQELSEKGHNVSHTSVGIILKEELGCTIRGNTRDLEPPSSYERNDQFHIINYKTSQRIRNGNPVLYLQTTWAEIVNPAHQPNGSEVQNNLVKNTNQDELLYPKAKSRDDTRSKTELAKYHLLQTFAIDTCRDWWQHSGSQAYPDAQDILIIADGGGSNGPRTRFWKLEIQKLACDIGLPILFCHFPTGTTRWNQVLYQINAQRETSSKEPVSDNYRVTLTVLGKREIVSREFAANQIADFILDNVPYEKFSQINIARDEYERDWNYAILPNNT